ncbi:MAG: peptidase U32 family protein [Bacteroidota bacterium]
MNRKEYEIMAPAGSWESLSAAINAGADSIYFGVNQLNMRSRSSANFTLEDFKNIVERCHAHQVKAYLTLNIAVYDNELELLRQIINKAVEYKADAIIASDQAVLNLSAARDIPIHISTQLNVSNIEAVKFYARFADVMVLARELNLDQVAAIYRQIHEDQITGPSGNLVKIEMFSHGALCMSVSGKCYLSLHEYNYSANRGACLQTCRRAYEVKDKETGAELAVENEYIMSPKDLKTIHFLNKMVDAGVKVFKLEGRARSPEYVHTVTSCYAEALQSVLEGTYSREKIHQWDERLKRVFNRGFWDGYYLGQRLGEWSDVYGSKASTKKVYIGKVTNFFSKLHVAEVQCETGTLKLGDEVLFIGETTGVHEQGINEMRKERNNIEKVSRGDVFSLPVNDLVRRGDKVYKVVNVKPETKSFQ